MVKLYTITVRVRAVFGPTGWDRCDGDSGIAAVIEQRRVNSPDPTGNLGTRHHGSLAVARAPPAGRGRRRSGLSSEDEWPDVGLCDHIMQSIRVLRRLPVR